MASLSWRQGEPAAGSGQRPAAPLQLGVVVIVTAIAAASRVAMTPLLGSRIPFLTFFPAIMVCAAFGGFWSGALCTALGALLVSLVWLPPIGSVLVDDAGDALAVLIFVGSGFAIATMHERLHRRQAHLAAARLEAETSAREAAAANRAKDEFLSILSHELRTPLTAILGWANTLRTRTCDAGTQTRALAAIERNAAVQARIVDDILDISRIITGQLRLELRPTDLEPVISASRCSRWCGQRRRPRASRSPRLRRSGGGNGHGGRHVGPVAAGRGGTCWPTPSSSRAGAATSRCA